MTQHQLAIGLLKPGTFKKVVLPKLAEWDEHDIEVDGAEVGSLFVPKAEMRRARWAAWFDGADKNPVKKCDQLLRSGLLHVRAGSREFVLPFGMSGRHAVPLEALEEHFGRNVTLNSVDPEKLRVIDNVRIEAEARQSRVQLSRAATFLAFALDPDQDLVRSIGGEPRSAAFGSRVEGSTYLSLQSTTTLSTLQAKLRECLKLFKSDAYKKDFDYLDALAPVRDPARIAALNAALVARVEDDKAPGRVWMAVPDVVDWTDVHGFAFRRKPPEDQIYPDLFLPRFRERLDGQKVTEQLLRRRHAYLIRTDGTPGPRWTVYRCLYAEIEDGDTVFVLTAGKWYAVHGDLVTKVNAFMKEVPATTAKLGSWPAGKGPMEDKFNAATAALDPTGRHNLDKKLVSYGGPNQKIEVCDVYCDDGVLIHAKKYTDSKPLSHLFAQGANAAELLLDEDFLKVARSKLKCLPPTWEAKGREIAFVVGTHSTKDLELPFFSRITFRAVAQRLRRFGYHVSLTGVTIA